jgi:putative alpha-1,2-mannosidase
MESHQMAIKLYSTGLFLFGVIGLVPSIGAQATAKRPIDTVNTLVGTAPLDQQKLIGNAPPPGEQLYSGFTSPAATLPHSSTELGPINANLDVDYPAGVRATYFYPNRTMYGFSTGTEDRPTLMPIVGDFTVPPERSGSVYDKSREKATPGYYSVYLDDYLTQVEMTATIWTGIFRITFPATNKANILLDLGRDRGDVEIIADNKLRGHTHNNSSYFVAEFSQPFQSFGRLRRATRTTLSSVSTTTIPTTAQFPATSPEPISASPPRRVSRSS